MTDEIKEVEQDALGDETTKKILESEGQKPEDNLKGTGKESEKNEEEADEKPEEKKDDEEKEEVEEKKEEDEEDEDASEKKLKRTPKLMPKYQHEIATKKWDKERGELLQKIDELSNSSDKKTDGKRDELVNKFADEHGWDQKLVNDLLNIVSVPNSEKELRTKIDQMEKDNLESKQEGAFNLQYDNEVLKFLDKDEVPVEKREQVKKLIKDLAFTEKYVGNDLDEIYIIARNKGMFDRLGLVKGKKSLEGSRGGSKGADTGEVDPNELEGEAFEKWSNEQAGKQSNRTFSHPDTPDKEPK